MKNKPLYFIIGFMLFSKILLCQSDSVNYFIKQLDWSSFNETTNYVPKLFVNDVIERLIIIDDPNKVDLLIQSLKDPIKTVAAHIVLTRVFEPSYNRFETPDVSGSPSTITYKYNGCPGKEHIKGTKICR